MNKPGSIAFIICLSCFLAMFSSCKPTEKNYRAAYDAAIAKREKANAENMLPASGLLTVDGPRLHVVGGDTLYVMNEHLKAYPDSIHLKEYNVAVAMFKMRTNASALASRLSTEKHAFFVAQGSEDKWYTIAGSFESLDAAIETGIDFKKQHPEYNYISLPGAPVIIRR